MKTIEQLLKPVICEDIQYLLNLENRKTKYNLLLTENFNMQNRTNTEYTIQAITQSGQGALTQIPNVKAVQTPLSIVFQIPVNYQREFIKILNTYILATNAVWSDVTDDLEDDDVLTSETYQYRLIWKAPIVSGSPYNIQVKSDKYDAESLSVVQIVLVGEVTHTSSFAMNDEQLYLEIQVEGENEYVLIEGIVNETEQLAPTINQTELMEQYLPEKDVAGDTQPLNITIAVQTSNPLHEYLMRLFYKSRTNSSFDIRMKRIRRSLSITQINLPMIMSLSRYVQNGFEYLTITLNKR